MLLQSPGNYDIMLFTNNYFCLQLFSSVIFRTYVAIILNNFISLSLYYILYYSAF